MAEIAWIQATDKVGFLDCIGQRGAACCENDLLDTGSLQRSKETNEPSTHTLGREEARALAITRASGDAVSAGAAF